MTTMAVTVVAWCALLVGVLAAVFVVPRPVPLEGERWFKTVLAWRLADPDVDVWRSRVQRWVPFHPLGRYVERKVMHPGIETMPGAPLEGERDLMKALAALPDPAARWAYLFDDVATELVGDSPLSPDHLPRRWLGRGTWQDVADDALAEEAEARLHARWVLVAGAVRPGVPDVHPAFSAFAAVVDGALPTGATDLSYAEGLTASLKALVPDEDPAARLLLAVTSDAAPGLLAALHGDMALRDRVLGVVAIGGILGGLPDVDGPLSEQARTDWTEAHFRHELLDVEVVHLIPYAAVQFVDRQARPPGAGGVPVAWARFATPGFVGREPPFVEVIDLGVLPADEGLPTGHVVGALRLVLDLWALSRR